MTTWTEEELAAHLIKQKGGAAPAKPPLAAAGRKESGLEQDFARLLAMSGLPEPEREAAYIPGRKFRADFLWRRAGLIVEAEGGVFGGKSGHNSGIGIEHDCERSRLASLHGYRVFRVTRKSLTERGPEIVTQLKEILAPWYGDLKHGRS